MEDTAYFSHLYEIARLLNKEFSLHSALRKALEKTIELFQLDTGWIWLVQEDNKSVYLAASYNLPPALGRYPERLSGRCFCIDKYLADGISKALNISEIACTRLQNITAGTRGLKFHATIPVTIEGRKVGLINLVSKESQQLADKELSVLNTISELVSISIQRTRMQGLPGDQSSHKHAPLREVLSRVVVPGMEELASKLLEAKSFMVQGNRSQAAHQVETTLKQTEELHRQLSLILDETEEKTRETTDKTIHYPTSPLSARELEVLSLVKKGYTNKSIAEQLFVSERTIKFHLSSILSKLLARTRTEAVETAIHRGLLSI